MLINSVIFIMFTHESAKFLRDFDPENSERVRRKRNRGAYENDSNCDPSTPLVYNERGIHIKTGVDLCDCLRSNCPGCHFPCRKCQSLKCGTVCRVNRTWEYDIVHTQSISRKEFEKSRPNPLRYPMN